MPAGIGVGQVARLLREFRGLEGSLPAIVISGGGAQELATALADGGDRSAIVVDGNPVSAALVLRIVDGDPDHEERAVLRRLANGPTPLIAVRRGGSERLPYVLADDVVELDADELGPGIGAIAAAIAQAAGAEGPSLAARLPVLRGPVSRRLITRTAFANAVIAASPKSVPQLPLLTLAQARMLLLGGLAGGVTLPRDPQELARAAGPSFAAALGTGLGARALVRRLPVRGPLVRAAIAYGGTSALGAALLRR